MSDVRDRCWCCDEEVQATKNFDAIVPTICQPCLDDKHTSSESAEDTFAISVDCDKCKTYRFVRVKRESAQKLFDNRDRIKCKGCGKSPVKLRIHKSVATESTDREDEQLEAITLAKEWRGISPQEAATS